MTLRLRLLPLLLAASTLPLSQMIFQGCATMLNGAVQKMKFDSRPAGATLYVNGRKIGETPQLVVFSRFQKPRIRFELEGYEPYEIETHKSESRAGGIYGYLGPAAPASWVIDALTGSIYQIDLPKQEGLTTKPWYKDVSGYGYANDQTLFVGVTLKPLPNGRKIGQMQRKL